MPADAIVFDTMSPDGTQRPEATREAYAQRTAEVDTLDARIEEAIGQERHYGIRVWSEPRPGSATPTWRRTDPAEGLDAFAFAWYRTTPPAVDVYTREQYERACAAVGITPAPDTALDTYADRYMTPTLWDLHPLQLVEAQLRRRRLAGLDRETAPARRAQAAEREQAAARAEAAARAAAEAAGRRCAECGALVIDSGMTASFGLACDVPCYDAMSDRPGRYATRRATT